jgi:ribosomal protein S18 acetylase RimI-like enzyme
MGVTYFKRFKMEIDLRSLPAVPTLPPGYFWVPWDEALLNLHAEVHHAAFCTEIDAVVFPAFSDRHGCQLLLRAIRERPGFLPAATWLIANGEGCCGAVQGLVDHREGSGSIQNVGVTPGHRGRGLGQALIIQALHGFRDHGLRRAYLEVTAGNEGALRLYYRLGFRKRKTLYKAVEVGPVPGRSWML